MTDETDILKVNASTYPLKIDDLSPFSESVLGVIEAELRGVIMQNNFDTFSFLFELLETADQMGISVIEAYKIFQVDSTKLLRKYNGSNCAGLSLDLRRRLSMYNIETEIAPSYGYYLARKEADEYVQIRTVDVVGIVNRGKNNTWVFLAPGLTIDKPIIVEEGFTVESLGRRYAVKGVNNKGFTFVTTKPSGETVERFFGFERFVNPDQSSQKNLLRCRTNYQITRQHQSYRERITFDLATSSFGVKTKEGGSVHSAPSFIRYIQQNGTMLESRFNNPFLLRGFELLVKYIDEIRDALIIPELQSYIREP